MKTLAAAVLALLVTASAFGANDHFADRPANRRVKLVVREEVLAGRLASLPGSGLARFAREGVTLENSSSRHVALFVGRGLGGDLASARGANWHVRLNLVW